MRPLLAVPALILLVACGAPKLSRKEVDRDLQVDYPVPVTVQVPESASEIKGSPAHAKLVALQELTVSKGWFTVQRSTEGDRERFRFQPGKAAPAGLTAAGGGFELPAAKATYAGAFRMERSRDGRQARVAYRVRLEQPSAFFPLFQIEHPNARVGQTAEREARYAREGRKWILQGTNERHTKAR